MTEETQPQPAADAGAAAPADSADTRAADQIAADSEPAAQGDVKNIYQELSSVREAVRETLELLHLAQMFHPDRIKAIRALLDQ